MPTPMSLNTTSQSPASALSLSLLCHRPESLPLSGLSFPGSNRPSLVLDVTIRSPKALRSEDLWLAGEEEKGEGTVLRERTQLAARSPGRLEGKIGFFRTLVSLCRARRRAGSDFLYGGSQWRRR